jgi:hypothetical protein
MQAAATTDLFTPIQGFLLAMVGLSVATERVTETLKEIICPTTKDQANAPSMSRALVQIIAIFSGMLVTALSTLDPIGITHKAAFSWSDPKVYLNWLVTGILVSGGSAFWNHLLDILQATKVTKEATAARATATANMAPSKGVAVAAPGAAQPVG